MSSRCSRLRSTSSPMMPAFLVIEGPTRSGVSSSTESLLNVGGQPFLGQFNAVALDAGEADFQVIALGVHGFDLDGLAGRLWGRHHWFGGEVERHPQDVGVFDVEQALLIEVVGLSAQGAANHLLAQQLGAEGTHAQHMRDIACVPAFGEHGDRDDAANGVAQPAWLADGVHDLTQQSPGP